MDSRDAALLAERIQSACVEAMLDLGQHLNALDALPEGPLKEIEATAARIAGGELIRIAKGLAAKLRPVTR